MVALLGSYDAKVMDSWTIVWIKQNAQPNFRQEAELFLFGLGLSYFLVLSTWAWSEPAQEVVLPGCCVLLPTCWKPWYLLTREVQISMGWSCPFSARWCCPCWGVWLLPFFAFSLEPFVICLFQILWLHSLQFVLCHHCFISIFRFFLGNILGLAV